MKLGVEDNNDRVQHTNVSLEKLANNAKEMFEMLFVWILSFVVINDADRMAIGDKLKSAAQQYISARIDYDSQNVGRKIQEIQFPHRIPIQEFIHNPNTKNFKIDMPNTNIVYIYAEHDGPEDDDHRAIIYHVVIFLWKSKEVVPHELPFILHTCSFKTWFNFEEQENV